MNPRPRWPRVVVFAIAAGLAAYAGTLGRDAWSAYLCHDAHGVWTDRGCTPPTLVVKHYVLNMLPQSPDSDVPTPPPVVPESVGPRL